MTSRVTVEVAPGASVVVKRTPVAGETGTDRVLIPGGGREEFTVHRNQDLAIHEVAPGEDWNTWG